MTFQKPAKPVAGVLLLAWVLLGCASVAPQSAKLQACEGELPKPPVGFTEVDDEGLVSRSLGAPGEGRLCQGRAYRVHGGPAIYRSFNSTNPGSELGDWWALEEPAGSVAEYREKYEICFQWSPLDKLVICKLREGATVVLGTGQSATCSEHLSYPASSVAQLFLASAKHDALECRAYSGAFNWSPEP